ncbi:hypothetical protein Taro_054335 [Colocasia esculenta]|uniref:PHD and RING finger domain-containing protein 1 n=1 Tax=Colocasia esculenta TaxID=4460 RepID=A0A843XQW1_COLES|nr:hypothetical protein [Colocasia esculenta]
MEEMSSHGLPNKRLKPLSRAPAPPPCGKGKGKMEEFTPEGDDADADTASDADERTCGICLTEEGRSIKGAIDSCDHYFCFVCIMEWAKIESRCPLCKQRFGSIRRPTVRGVLFSERVVYVPVRDQVHQPFGNATVRGDPYADTSCSACHGSTDENLLLLCDLCDSAAHTYCVGLGFTVPEGDWYCHDCTILRNEHTKMQDDHCSDENFNRVSRTTTEDCSPVSIFELVRDETSSYSFSGSQTKGIGRGTNEREPKDKAAVKQNSKGNALHSDERPSRLAPAVESSSSLAEAKATELGARTLHQCRNLHLRIRILRDNWCALRNGSLDFRSSLVFPCGTSNSREHKTGIISSISRHQGYQSSGGNEEVSAAGSQVSNEMNSCTSSHDVDKAWKMLEIVKSMQRAPAGAKSSQQSPNLSHKKSNGENKVLEQRQVHHVSDRKSLACPTTRRIPKDESHENGLFGGAGLDKYFRHDSSEILREKCKLQNNGEKNSKLAKEEIGHCDKRPSLSSVRENLKRDRELCHGSGQDSQHGIYHASASGGLKDASACSGPSNCNQVGTFGPAGKKEAPEDVGCNILPSNASSVRGKNVHESSSRICDSAKSEIQSLVKLNLKLQCKGHHLGTEEFKEVARVATHTILAACGFDHSRSKARPFPSSICRHGDQTNLRRSNLMPDSCRDCFYSFVKDVVESVVSEKTSVSTKA